MTDPARYRALLLDACAEADAWGVPVPAGKGYMQTWTQTLYWAGDDQLTAIDHELHDEWERVLA